MSDPALAEIAALRERLANLEATAAAAAGPTPMLDSVGRHYSTTPPPKDPAHKALERDAHGFVPDPQADEALRQRAAMGTTAYEAQLRAAGGNPLELALYARQKEAAEALAKETK